tara:strand:- start:244 stop:816 length:573 start_codon:yes stop_codon:yes gene_type:complete
MNKKPIGVFISGRGSNLESIINACKDENFPAKVVCVFSDNANAEGLQFALKNNIDTHTLDLNNFESKDHFEEEILKLIKPYNIELICLAGYMKIITDTLISGYPNRIINIHPSLLPKFKGLDTHQRALDAQEVESGCSVHYVNSKIDDGRVIMQTSVAIEKTDNADTLAKKVLKAEHELYPASIIKLLRR